MKPRAVHVHIGELVLRGFSRGERHAIAAALEHSLSRALAGGVPLSLQRPGTLDRLPGGLVAVSATAGAAEVGARAGTAVYGALAR